MAVFTVESSGGMLDAMRESFLALKPMAAYIVVVAGFLLLLYQWLLPKPLPSIPYNRAATKTPLGDVPAMLEHVKKTGDNTLQWMAKQGRTPLMQIFLNPTVKLPMVLLSDPREAYDLLTRRVNEFDRSDATRDDFIGILQHNHVQQPTNDVWRARRKLLQDTMSPSFLQNVAAPVMIKHAEELIALWRHKARLAGDHPFRASRDILDSALDTVDGFVFGEDFPSATQPNLRLVEGLVQRGTETAYSDKKPKDEEMVFPPAEMHEDIEATYVTNESTVIVRRTFLKRLAWTFVKMLPRMRRAFRMKDAFIARELTKAARKLQWQNDNRNETEKVELSSKSVVDHMVQREAILAQKAGRDPVFSSPVMVDEVFGFIVAGYDTSAGPIEWAVKLLADYPDVQTCLRLSLKRAFPEAWAECRQPNIEELSKISIPYLDATVEEILRFSTIVPIVLRMATRDTELLGYHIPKGTNIAVSLIGPGMLSPGFEDSIDEGSRSKSCQKAPWRTWDPASLGAFQPERWLVHSEDKEGERRFDGASGPQMSLGLGPRSCFGKRMGYLGVRILLSLILWNFEFLPCPEELSGYKSSMGIVAKPNQCYVRLREIEIGCE